MRLLHHLHAAAPLSSDPLRILQNIAPTLEREKTLNILNTLNLPSSDQARLNRCLSRGEYEKASALLDTLLRGQKNNVGVAAWRLQLDERTGENSERWLRDFVCPLPLMSAWNKALFQHFARMGMTEQALARWEAAPDDHNSPYALALAGSLFARAGDPRQAMRCFMGSLQKDPRQIPVRLRLNSLANPPVPDRSLLTSRRTIICLYSWNKSAFLERTLRSLAASDTGHAPVYVLLNGCTDDSRARVEALRPLLAPAPLHLVELPINIGAPAARNWLLALPEVAGAEYVAFMDDDVEMPSDWLARYLSLMETDPAIGAVGCKVVFPQTDKRAPRMQYFYRMITLAMEGLLKASIAVPDSNARDTGLYDFTRECMSVMGCLHLLRGSALRDLGGFDIRFSPSQLDDIDHDLRLCLHGYKVMYCGEVTCVHHQNSGIGAGRKPSVAATGSVIGNDVKLTYKHADNMEKLRTIAREIHARTAERA